MTPMGYGSNTWNEEAMDYQKSIMDEVMGLHPTTPMQKQNTFNYAPLDQPKHEIRVVDGLQIRLSLVISSP
jgi:hypothetical protein